MLQGHEDGVDDDADSDGQLSEGVGHHGSQDLLKAHPLGVTVPYEVFGCQVFPAWEARLLGFFLFWRRRMKEQLRIISEPVHWLLSASVHSLTPLA